MSGHFEWTKDYNDAVQDRQAEIFANKKAAQEQTADLGEEPPTPTPIDPPSVAPTEPTIDDPDKPEAKVVDLEAQNIDVAIEDEQTPAVPEPAITTPEQQDEAPLTFAWSREAGASQFLDHQDLKMENAEGTPAPSDDRADTKEKGDGELQMSFMSQLDHSHSH
jgi:hypothetical protein